MNEDKSLFVETPSLISYYNNKQTLNPNAIVFIKNTQSPGIMAQDTLYRTVPTGTVPNTVLAWDTSLESPKWIPFTDGIYIKGYLNSINDAPSDSVVGSIYLVRPAEGVEPSSGKYEMYIKTESGWINNGPFNSLPVGIVQTTGQSTSEVMSQKAVTNAISLLTPIKLNSEEEYEKMLSEGTLIEGQLYYIAEE